MLKTTGKLLAAASIAVAAAATGAAAQPYDHGDQGRYDHHDYNGRYDHHDDNNRYDHGRYNRDHYRRDTRARRYYGSDCHNNGNQVAGTVAGAVIGGIIGNQFGSGSGKTAATVGGVILGGAAGNALAKNVSCDNRPYAYSAYRDGFRGRVGHRYDWRHGHAHGYIKPIREYRRHGRLCREYVEVNWHHGHKYRHRGTACRYHGDWRVRS